MSSQHTTNDDLLPIVDSHIHLYASSHIPRLSWTGDLPAAHALNRQNSISEYRAATANYSKPLLGFVFLETDRISGLKEDQWDDALEEVSFLLRIARGTPLEGDGHSPNDSSLVLGIVPWAPVPAGAASVKAYIAQVTQRASNGDDDKWSLIKGFRYLVQDKPRGVMLEENFLSGLKYLGDNNLTFDLGVDARSGGLHQLEEACEMMRRLYSEPGTSTLKIVINHFCKANLRITAQEARDGHPDFTAWRDCIATMAIHGSTYMKLSGMFSELPEQMEDSPVEISTLVEQTKPWVDVVFEVFGPSRIMFGSDWPVCNVGGPGIKKSWSHWHDVVEGILAAQNLTRKQKARVWAGTAVHVYGIRLQT